MISCWMVAMASGLCVLPVHGQISSALPQIGTKGKFKAVTQQTFNDSRNSVSASGEIPGGAVRPGAMVPVAIQVKIKKGWHMWPVESQANSVVGATVFEGAIFSTLALQATEPQTTSSRDALLKLVGAQWPLPVGAQFNFGEGKQTLAVYEGAFVVFAAIQVDQSAKNGPLPLTLILNFQSCDDTSCLAPAEIEIPITLQVDSAAVAVAPSGVFQNFDPAK